MSNLGPQSIDIAAGVGAAENRSIPGLLNTVKDQETVFDLLCKIPLSEGGALETSIQAPMFVRGQASPILVRMLRSFQSAQSKKRNLTEREGFAQRGGPTIAAMNEIIAAMPSDDAQGPTYVPEVRGIWQILNVSSIREGGPIGPFLVELLKRRKIPIDIDSVAITVSGPENQKDFIVGAGAGFTAQISLSEILTSTRRFHNSKLPDDLFPQVKEIEDGSATIRTLLKILGVKLDLVKDGAIFGNPLVTNGEVGISDLKVNRHGINTFIVLSGDAGFGLVAGASIIFFHPHILAGIAGCQAIGFYGKMSLDTRIGAGVKVMVYSNSRFVTGEPGLTPGTPLPGGGEVPDWPFN